MKTIAIYKTDIEVKCKFDYVEKFVEIFNMKLKILEDKLKEEQDPMNLIDALVSDIKREFEAMKRLKLVDECCNLSITHWAYKRGVEKMFNAISRAKLTRCSV